MDITGMEKLQSSFGLFKAPSELVAQSFLSWQKAILRPWGFDMKLAMHQGTLPDGIKALWPRTAPIATRYLFWPLNENWTLYLDNAVNGTDPGPLSILSSRLDVDSIRVVMADETTNPATGQTTQYRATILEYYSKGVERRHVFVVNDGGKWKFGALGEPFQFEDTTAYEARSIKNRFTSSMLLSYLKQLGVDLNNGQSVFIENGPGYLLTKHGKMPANYKEFEH